MGLVLVCADALQGLPDLRSSGILDPSVINWKFGGTNSCLFTSFHLIFADGFAQLHTE